TGIKEKRAVHKKISRVSMGVVYKSNAVLYMEFFESASESGFPNDTALGRFLAWAARSVA
ncbi:MAG: hypothetical protein LBB48_02885, partial [Treponema sp.]|nr:hypothetical protein [Treponema sp.]